MRPADLLASVKDTDEVIRMAGIFLQYYRENGRYGERTSSFLERVGLGEIREIILEDSPIKRTRLEERLDLSIAVLSDPWEEGRAPITARQFEGIGTA